MTVFKNSRKRALFAAMVIVPMIIAIIYYALFAIDRYVSSAQVVVRQPSQDSAEQSVPSIALMMAGLNPASREETLYLREFVTSIDMLKVLEKQLNWREHFSGQWRDPWLWIGNNDSNEELLKFYNRMVEAHFDDTTGLLTIEVQGLTPEFAKQTLDVILDESEKFVNEMSHKMAREHMKFAESELQLARTRYENERGKMLAFQGNSEMLNAEAAAESRAAIIASLEAQLTSERAKLKGLLASLGSNTPRVQQQQVRIKAMEDQLRVEKQLLVSPTGGDKLNVMASEYRNLVIDVGIAEEAYKASTVAVENARIEVGKKIRTLIMVVTPNLAQEAIYPARLYNLITLLIVFLLLYGLARFIIASIQDHRD
ncbi:ABC transporter permease [Bordetella petrii]|nr:ABC transporter permease [Bordetella petrii]